MILFISFSDDGVVAVEGIHVAMMLRNSLFPTGVPETNSSISTLHSGPDSLILCTMYSSTARREGVPTTRGTAMIFASKMRRERSLRVSSTASVSRGKRFSWMGWAFTLSVTLVCVVCDINHPKHITTNTPIPSATSSGFIGDERVSVGRLGRVIVFFIASPSSKMPRGPKKHLKRLNAPSHWMLAKLGGTWAPKPSSGPHKGRESLPLIIILRNRLRYALTAREVKLILMQRLVKVDHVVRTDSTFPAGFMDVVQIEKTGEEFRLLYDTDGRFVLHRIKSEEAKFKLLRVQRLTTGAKGIPYIVTHDGRTIRFPHPDIKVADTIQFNLDTKTVTAHVPFEIGNLVTITGGRSIGRIGIVESKERHPGSHDIVHVKDSVGQTFATRATNVFVIGKGNNSLVSIPSGKGVKLSITEKREIKIAGKASEEN
eukprot:TRINITY_DN406_c0_g1_i1.p1 TRINITY_DN406_c0_g1~~TRINITY_DN406_c0_g1_i1.p1  ORF type:complete len:429 (-),score=146.84 TRINITY_DN406_c0_g1_i1:39-1325(-)